MNSPPAPPAKIAFIAAAWHQHIVGRARESFLVETAALSDPPTQVDVFEVPGAFEIPLFAQRLAASGAYGAIVGAALVVDGGIYRHEFVATAVVDGLMRVQLDSHVPVFSLVLTPHHFHEHSEHSSYFERHFAVKGAEAARTCATTLAALAQLNT